ncbi:MAG TPA: hypothetical protein VN442_23815 [Bryobacteraceae bacterium]|nr:hypothetical protein [Bryobacteraceae bacterium]
MLLLLVIVAFGFSSARAEAAPGNPPPGISRALGCLLNADFVREALASIGLEEDSHATIRFHIGSVPGMQKTPDTRWIAVYSSDGRRGWLFLANPDANGSFIVVRNGYRLTKHALRWSAVEGNGGQATYAAIGRLAASLAQSEGYRIKLAVGRTACVVQ